MDFIKYTRPKLPRNKYGILATEGYFSGSIVSSDGEIEISDDTTVNNPTNNTTQVVNNIYRSEWYNIQNKIVHGYQTARDSSGKVVMTGVVDECGNAIYNEDGTQKTKPYQVRYNTTWVTVIENFDASKGLLNSGEYRFFLMRFRKTKREGKRWRIPAFSPAFTKEFLPDDDGVINLPKMTYEEQDTWWKVEGAETRWWASSTIVTGTTENTDGTITENKRLKVYTDVLPVNTENIKLVERHAYTSIILSTGEKVLKLSKEDKPMFKNSGSSTMLVGCALFKRESTGAFGWQRVSNIATIRLRLSRSGSIIVEPNI